MRTFFRSVTVGLRGLRANGFALLSVFIVAALVIAGVALLPLLSQAVQFSSSQVPAASNELPGAVNSLPYAPAQEAELARLRYEALQAQWLQRQRADEAVADYTPAQEIQLAHQRYEILRAQWPALYH